MAQESCRSRPHEGGAPKILDPGLLATMNGGEFLGLDRLCALLFFQLW
jgi:hypothetical protein